ncbi:hypothetical protein Tco_0720865 [Tanacetum coccineum]
MFKSSMYYGLGMPGLFSTDIRKEEEDSRKGKVKERTNRRDFSRVFPEDLPGLPPARPVEFQIDLIPGSRTVARAPYRLAPSEMKELSEQLQELSRQGIYKAKFLTLGSLPEVNAFQLIKKKLCSAILGLPEGSVDFGGYTVMRQTMEIRCCLVNRRERSRKERIEPLRVRALVMTIGLDLPKRILEAHIEALKLENIVNEDVGDGKLQRIDKRCYVIRSVSGWTLEVRRQGVLKRSPLRKESLRFGGTSSRVEQMFTTLSMFKSGRNVTLTNQLSLPLEGILVDDKAPVCERGPVVKSGTRDHYD